MKKLLALVFLATLTAIPAMAQYSIQGKVVDKGGTPIAFTTIQLLQTSKAVSSNEAGQFSINNVSQGFYALKVSFVGFKSITQQLTVANENVDLGTIVLSEAITNLDQMVVTASRLEQTIADVSIPIQVIDQKQIERSSNIRLNEILMEQTGLMINSDHGAGIQIQGLNSEYILILVDGEPLIGRTAGTLDLTRITVNNIDRIEVVKGPSSSLYGSEAMGGVINIITKNPRNGLGTSLSGRQRRFNTTDLNATLEYANDKVQVSTFFNRLSSGGYDLNDNTLSQTVASYTASTAQAKLKYKLTDNLDLSISGRYYNEPQEDQTTVTISNGSASSDVVHDYNAQQTDWNILPKLEWRIGENSLVTLRQYISNYRTETRITRASDNNLYSLDIFEQKFSRTEGQGDLFINENSTITFGAGYIWEGVNSTRYVDSSFTSAYAFAQYLWEPTAKLDITTGLRYDDHVAYGNNLSPKLAVGYKLNEKLKVRASIGGGFKAPDFRQLLLDFSNPTVGYSVMGTSVVQDGIERLISAGETFRTDPQENPNAINNARANAAVAAEGLSAERSLSINLGANYQLTEKILIQGNLFRNYISNLIDTWAVAQKDNGQFVFSYRNVEDIVTQGAEVEATVQLNSNLNISAGYQYLDTYDQNVIDQIKEGTLAYRPLGEIVSRRVTRADYGGLFGRSRHSGNFKVTYTYSPLGLTIYFRSIYRGRWGFADRDGNQVLVGDYEYAEGYFQHNLSIQKAFGKHWTADLGANNLFNTTNEFEPTLAGTMWFAGLKFNLHKD
ncbi:hypothetical protein AWW68_10330 [Roseivirga spongicola]|uniref:TonB-dependent receptor n=1 Tax=Roseivirga spongicola TaxID=333140 RepID=A0A150X8Y5_9BACT|nr:MULTISPECIES: TonB-dependent receptor [Roseivirga]KYG75195.1 hypothetical protein AWW68_10330 [Roseivirga spongicola]MBO6662016.1 TonB-dependent receptor [Roseivirga sp.]MBO6760000.1 TonB-dependent receptor [Roseivirga sp.]MBO6909395.1 TonB-dependent receptor [Roseivirga sp.]